MFDIFFLYLFNFVIATSTDTCPSPIPIEFATLSIISSSLSFLTLTSNCPINNVFIKVALFIFKKYLPGSSFEIGLPLLL